MKISINMPDELLKQIDEKAADLYISRSAYITTAVASKLSSDKVIDGLPEILQQAKEIVKLEKERRLGQADGEAKTL